MNRKMTVLSAASLIFTFVLGCARLDSAQVVDERTRIDTDLVLIDVLVMDREVKPVPGLNAGQFELFIDKVRQPVDVFSAEADPVTLGIVYDMHPTTADKTRAVIESFQAFKKKLGADDDVFLVAFDQRGLQAFDFVPTLEQVERHMSKPDRPQLRALYDAVYFASEKITASRNQKRVLLIISDSADHRSRHTFNTVRQKLTTIRTEVYAVIVDDHNELGYTDMTHNGRETFPFSSDAGPGDRAALMDLTLKSGGATFFSGSRAGRQLYGIYDQIVAEMRSHYTLGFYPDIVDGKEHSIKVRLRGVSNSKEYTLVYRMSYRGVAK